MRYAICNETFQSWTHQQICKSVADLGYTGLEIAPFTLANRITDLRAAELTEMRKVAEDHGLTIIGLHWLLAKTTGFQITSTDEVTRKRTGEYLAELAKAAHLLGGDILVLGSPLQRKIPEGKSREDAFNATVETISYCLDTLKETGVYLCIEPLAPTETDFLQTAAEGVELIEKLDHPNVKLHLDVKAMSSEKLSIPEIIHKNASWTKHFHANDPNLRGPGFGEMKFEPIFQALKDSRYSGWVSVEVFDYSPDPETIARESIRYMREVESRLT
jgi:sugar phosphate isomerase/epimerase